MGSIADKLTYLNTTKTLLREGINSIGGNILPTDTFRSYALYLNGIYDKLPKVSGTGITISLNDTDKGRLATDLKGNTYQETTTGANLQKHYVGSRTVSDVTMDITENGQITITGTASTGLTNYRINTADDLISLTAGTYVIKVIGSFVGTGPRLKVRGTEVSLDSNQEYTFTLNEDINDFYLSVIIGSGTTCNSNFYITLAKDTPTTERYTYGATPNPNYPQKVHTVSGNNNLTICKKNLLPFTNQDFSYRGIRYYVQNGSLYIDGTATSETSSTYEGFKDNFSFTLQPGTYTIKRSNGTRTYLYDENNNSILSDPAYINANTARTFTLNKTTNIHLGFYLAKNTVINNVNTQIMLEVGSTASTYEAYTGITYPINLPVQNLFDKNNYSSVRGYFNSSGTQTIASSNANLIVYISCKPNTTYTASKLASKKLGIGYTTVTPDVNVTAYNCVHNNTGTSVTTTTGADAKYLVVYVRNGNMSGEETLENIINSLQIEESDKANSYTPYGTTPIEVCKIGDYEDKFVRDENIFDKNNATFKEGFTKNDEGVEVVTSGYGYTSSYTIVSPNKEYTISGTLGTDLRIYYYDIERNWISRSETMTSPSTFTTPSNCCFIQFQFGLTYDSSTIQINKGTLALPYTSYGDIKWYLQKNVGKVVLNGSEKNWGYSSTNIDFSIRPYYLGMRSSTTSTGYIPKVCNYFKYYASNGNTPNLADGIYENTNTSQITFLIFHCDSLNITTLQDWYNWLSTNKPIIYYTLATSTYTEITGTLNTQLEDIYNAQSYIGQTNILQENNDLPFNLIANALEM